MSLAKYTLQNISFEWDTEKAAINLRRHGIPFELACEAFFDPFVSYVAEEVIEGEIRESIIGMTTTWQILFIVYTLRGEFIRIITARPVTNEERKNYET